MWKCSCGWKGKEPAIVFDGKIDLEIFCPVNCGKEPTFEGTPEQLTEFWLEWYQTHETPTVSA